MAAVASGTGALLLTVLLALCHGGRLWAQDALFDAVDDEAAHPQLDAIERYREEPLCLRAATPRDVAMIPGMSMRLAAQVLRTAAARPTWGVDAIADSLCLGLAQRLVLLLCTTTRCDTARWSVLAAARAGSRLDATLRLAAHYGPSYVHGIATRAPDDQTTVGHVSATLGTTIGATSVVLGDMALRVGSGLLMAGATLGRARSAGTHVDDDAMAIRPWTSSMRYGFLRGGAVYRVDTIGRTSVQSLLAASYRPLIGRMHANAEVASIQEQQSLFTQQVAADRTVLHEAVAGGSVSIGRESWHVGASAWLLRYDKPLATASSRDISGTGGISWSVFGSSALGSNTWAWEIARDVYGNTGLVGQLAHRSAAVRYGISTRWLGAAFRSPYGTAPTDASAPSNEAGITLSATWLARPDVRIDANLDLRRTFDRTYVVPRPVRATTIDLMVHRRLPNRVSVHGRCYIDDDDDAIRLLGVARLRTARRMRIRVRAGIDAVLAKPLTVSCRLDASYASWTQHRTSMHGSAMMVRSRLALLPWLHLTMQALTYVVPGIDAALYTAEVPMPGVMRSVTLVGSGSRIMAGVHARVSHTISVWAALSETARERRADIMVRWTPGGVRTLSTDE